MKFFIQIVPLLATLTESFTPLVNKNHVYTKYLQPSIIHNSHESASSGILWNTGSDESEPVPLTSMLKSSQLVYTYAAVRGLVNEYDGEIDFVTPAHVVTKDAAEDARHLKSSLLKNRVTAAAFLQFVQENRNFFDDECALRKEKDRKKNPSELKELKFEQDLELMRDAFDADIWEFDDEYTKSELVFSILVNRSEKRIICVFRGSVGGGKDWSTNFKIAQTAPDLVKEFAGNIGIHYGFANYLFNDKWTKDGEPSKFEQIVNILKEIRTKTDANGDQYKDYDIFVTGHSLGGALSQLLAFGLAGSSLTKDEFPMPITAVTFASPQAGNRDFRRFYQKLEKQGSLRHVRVSNSGDHVCVQPAIPLMGFSQTGVNIHLYAKKEADVGYRNQRSAYSAIRFSNPLAMHGLDSYFDRITNGSNDDILACSVEKLYDEHAGDFTN